MKEKAPIIIGIAILVAVVITVTSIVVRSYNENKSIMPDATYSKELSKTNLENIKKQYERDGVDSEFEEIYKKIELAVANKMLDGTVTSDSELKAEIVKLNNMFKTDDWSYLGVEFPKYWMGTWSLDDNAKLYFAFSYEEIKPVWTSNVEVSEYIK